MKTIVALLLLSSTAFAAAKDKDEYSKLVCNKHNVCHVVKVKKISDSVTYLDMSEIEGKTDDMPAITPKGKL